MNRAMRTGRPLLTWRDALGQLRILELQDVERYSIGRRPSMSVVIAWDARVSGLHAELDCVGGEWVISDDGLSRNGTRVNGELIRQRTRLRDQDRIAVGHSLLAFHAASRDAEITSTMFADEDDAIPAFDATDRDILIELCRDYLVQGRPQATENTVIAATLHLSVNTIKKRLTKMYQRCGIALARNDNRAELMRFVVQRGVVSLRDYDHGPAREQP
jgi:hypothetical protein